MKQELEYSVLLNKSLYTPCPCLSRKEVFVTCQFSALRLSCFWSQKIILYTFPRPVLDLSASSTGGWFLCMNCSFQVCAATLGLAAAYHLFGHPPRQHTQPKEYLSSFYYWSHPIFVTEFNRFVHKSKWNKINTKNFSLYFLQFLLRNLFLSRLSVFYPISALQFLHIGVSQQTYCRHYDM